MSANKKRFKRSIRPSVHHRKPTSIKGHATGENTVEIPHDIHMEWHTLVANKCAPKIATLLSHPFQAKGYKIDCRRMPTTIHPRECPTDKPCANMVPSPKGDMAQCAHTAWTKRHQLSLDRLEELISRETGERASPIRTVKYINAHLLDSDYRLILSLLKKRKSGR